MLGHEMTAAAARRHVRALRGLYVHATVFALVNALLLAVDLLTPGGPWFFWPLLGWGVGLVTHALAVGGPRPWDAAWEDRKVRELTMRRG